MKKEVLSIVALAIFNFASAQLNPSLDIWTGIEPDNWYTFNQYASMFNINGQCVYKDMDASDGPFSARLVTKYCPNCPAGIPSPLAGYIQQETPFLGNLSDLHCFEFDYKYLPAAVTDSGGVEVIFSHWDSMQNLRVTDYISSTYLVEKLNWTAESSVIMQLTSDIPDTMTISFFSSIDDIFGIGTDTDGTELFVDNIKIVSDSIGQCTIGLLEVIPAPLKVTVYPNPASDIVVLEFNSEEAIRVDFFDINGRIAQSSELLNGRNEIVLDNLLPGRYSYIISSRKRETLASGKLMVGAD